MGQKSSGMPPRRKSPAGRVEFTLTGVLPGESKVAESGARQPESAAMPAVDTEERARWIAEAAYYRAEKRGFMSGFELEDWAAAEAEYDARCTQQMPGPKGPAN